MKDGITGMIDAFNSYKVETEKQLEDTRKLAMNTAGANSGSAKKDTGGGSGGGSPSGSPSGASKPAGNNSGNYHYRFSTIWEKGSGASGTATGEGTGATENDAKKAALSDSYRKIPPNAIRTHGDKYTFLGRYQHGGLIDFTGPAWVDGSKSRPESVLTAAQTATLRNDILSNKPTSLLNLLTDFRDAYGSIAGANSYGTINNNAGVNIEQATVEMHVAQIANDYDASRAGEQALEKIMAIARKS
jgi:hypothetical protein